MVAPAEPGARLIVGVLAGRIFVTTQLSYFAPNFFRGSFGFPWFFRPLRPWT